MPLVSVVIPSYNHARYVEAAIRSVLDQDHADVELVVIDDGSRDGSPELIRDLLSDAKGRTTVFEAQANAGAHAAISRGLSLARGDVLTVLNSDDHYETHRFSTLLAAVQGRDEFLAFSKVRFIDDDGRPMAPDSGIQTWYDRALRDAAGCPTIGFGLLRNNFSVTSGNLVFTRGLFEKVGGFRHFKMCHDWDFLMRATHLVEPVFVQSTLMAYRVHATNTLHSTRHLLEVEGVEALNAYLSLEREQRPPNLLAPSAAHWPLYFEHFLATRSGWFSERPLAEFVAGGTPVASLPCVEPLADASRLGLPDLGIATDARDAGPNLSAFAFLREAALRDLTDGAGRAGSFYTARLFGAPASTTSGQAAAPDHAPSSATTEPSGLASKPAPVLPVQWAAARARPVLNRLARRLTRS